MFSFIVWSEDDGVTKCVLHEDLNRLKIKAIAYLISQGVPHKVSAEDINTSLRCRHMGGGVDIIECEEMDGQ